MAINDLTFFEFFAGGGMARLGLGDAWTCRFANDWSEKKAESYRSYFGPSPELVVRDVAKIATGELPGTPDLVWASFPCQDLSLAGNYAGLKGSRSGTFRPFWTLMKGLAAEGRKPPLVVLENVFGALTSHGGKDFETIVRIIATAGYSVGAMVIDAVRFVPQSRPRLFIIAVADEREIPVSIRRNDPSESWHPRALVSTLEQFPSALKSRWIFWNLPEPPARKTVLSELIEDEPTGVEWHSLAVTNRLLSLMSDLNREKVRSARRAGERIVGTVYKRTRPLKSETANVVLKAQRAEARFDEISGCLRTPTGGSSRQTILVVNGKKIRSRLLSPREAARIMGVPDQYPVLPNYNHAYHVFGDGLVVPVVSWLEQHLLRPIALQKRALAGVA
jgi:DNA (cytosine-5)-methyltransferase 1